MQKDSKNKKRLTRKQALEVLLGKNHASLSLFKDTSIHILMAHNGALLIAASGADVFEFENGELDGLMELRNT